MKDHRYVTITNVETFLKIKIIIKYNILVTNINILRQYENTNP